MAFRALLPLLLLGWVLQSADRNGDWAALGDFSSSGTCERVRSAHIERDTLDAIGRPLADQPSDNPLRREAYDRAVRRASERYRCNQD